MKYIYYPGCSLQGSAREYDASTRAVMEALGAQLVELEDWTCCGASAAEARSGLLPLVLGGRNLALGERMDVDGDFLVPCSACYLNLKRVTEKIRTDDGLLERINEALTEENLHLKGESRVRHLLDIMARDFETEDIRDRVRHPLKGIRVAPYYGCQCLRPYEAFDDPERPSSMEPLIEALGAEVHPWQVGSKCCGAGLMTTKKDVALELTAAILSAAQGADCIATVCPMCQMNLEAFQADVSRHCKQDLRISALYLPQLLGLAFGLPEASLGLDLNLALTSEFKNKLA
jgi:heterodisulfide reductase subunit B